MIYQLYDLRQRKYLDGKTVRTANHYVTFQGKVKERDHQAEGR